MPIPFLYILGVGILLGLVLGFKSFIPFMYWDETADYDWYRYAMPDIINYIFWPFLVPLVYWTIDNYKIGRGATQSDVVKTLAMSLLIPLIHETLTNVIYFSVLHYAGAYEFSDKTWGLVKGAFPSVYIGRVVEFWIIYGLFAAFDYYKKYKDKQSELARIESQLNRSKLAVLKMQLQPHFLFNALNSISSLMELDVKKAQVVTARLGDLLRGILDQNQRVFVSVEEELNYVKSYLDIEKIRFEDRLDFEYDVQEEAKDVQVPLLTIQPLVENSVKHGAAPISRKVKITIRVKREGDRLIVEVMDNGKGQKSSNGVFGRGIGLRNLRERLNELYKGQTSVQVETSENSGFKVILHIPTHPIYENNKNHSS